jgi:undecaprenyl-diphosphatase
MIDITYLQAIVIGLLQGVTELFPISSLGHSVLVPAWIGGDWAQLVTQYGSEDSSQSQYLSFIVALHFATAIALLVFYWRTWIDIIKGFFATIKKRSIDTSTERLAWLIIVATIPVGITGLLFEHAVRTLFSKPFAAAAFLTLNGLILLAGEWLRRRADSRAAVEATSMSATQVAETELDHAVVGGKSRQLDNLSFIEAAIIGLFQTTALLAGISRSGITMVGGLVRGLSHEDAAKFSFLLATPVIFAASLLKMPALFGTAGANIHGQVIVGAIVAGLASWFSIKFLTKYFTTRTLIPFAMYCLVFGAVSLIHFA